MAPPKALIFIAHGTEEMEFTITYDTLVRAGVECTSVFVPEPSAKASAVKPGSAIAVCSRNVKIVADCVLGDENTPSSADLVVVPGGAKGADTISQNESVQRTIKEQFSSGKLVGMICAGSLAAKMSGLHTLGVELPLTSHPSVKQQLDQDFKYREGSVVVDDSRRLVTSRGPGTAFPFALKLVELLLGEEKRNDVQGPMVFAPGTIL